MEENLICGQMRFQWGHRYFLLILWLMMARAPEGHQGLHIWERRKFAVPNRLFLYEFPISVFQPELLGSIKRHLPRIIIRTLFGRSKWMKDDLPLFVCYSHLSVTSVQHVLQQFLCRFQLFFRFGNFNSSSAAKPSRYRKVVIQFKWTLWHLGDDYYQFIESH